MVKYISYLTHYLDDILQMLVMIASVICNLCY